MANFCTHCGAKLSKDDNFCTNCGTKIDKSDLKQNNHSLKSAPKNIEKEKAKKDDEEITAGIAEEEIVYEDDIYYEIIKFIAGESAYLDEPDIEFGPKLRVEKSMTFRNKDLARINEIDLLLSKNIPEVRSLELKAEKKKIEEVL